MLWYMWAYIIMLIFIIILVCIFMYNLKTEKINFRLLLLILLGLVIGISVLLVESDWYFNKVGHNFIIFGSSICLIIIGAEGR